MIIRFIVGKDYKWNGEIRNWNSAMKGSFQKNRTQKVEAIINEYQDRAVVQFSKTSLPWCYRYEQFEEIKTELKEIKEEIMN